MELWKPVFLVFCMAVLVSAASAATISIESFNYSPSPAEPGDVIDVWVTIKNTTGPTAEDVTVELDIFNESRTSTFPFVLPEGEILTKNIGLLPGDKSKIVKFTLLIDPMATSGDYNVTVTALSKAKAGKEEKHEITISTSNPQIELINSSVMEAKAGQRIETVLTLKNVGSSEAINILVGVEEDRTVTSTGVVVEREINALGSNFIYIDNILPNDEKTAKLRLGINRTAENKTYLVPITIKWKDEEKTDYSATRYIGIRVSSDPEIDAVISSTKPIAYPGGESELVFDMFNVGSASALYVVVELESEGTTIAEAKQFIGTLEADDFDSFKTKFKFGNEVQPGQHPVTLTIKYKNEENTPVEITKTLYVNVCSAEEAMIVLNPPADPVVTAIGIIIVLVILYLLYRKFIKKKKKA